MEEEYMKNSNKQGFSLNFTKKNEKKVLSLSAISEKDEVNDTPEYMTSVDGGFVERYCQKSFLWLIQLN